MSTPYISFIVPVMNEEENVAQLHAEIVAAAKKINKPFEIIFIDDGSSDNTSAELQKLDPITILRMRRNFGQTASMDAGIKAAQGEFLVTLDGDLQNDPADVPQMLQKLLDEDLDVVCGWRKHRQDSWSKRFISQAPAGCVPSW
ncbi:glycosyltransferase family 2 protein [Candidatus Woesebacteria bacterium]|nr:glycosyltransferase family 2 protein [Candidatus Woesebacteria bacterium]